jgi:hypothetical protein
MGLPDPDGDSSDLRAVESLSLAGGPSYPTPVPPDVADITVMAAHPRLAADYRMSATSYADKRRVWPCSGLAD